MRRPRETVQSGPTDIDAAMTPMIDVVFLLLVFFVWTASFQIIEQVLPSQLVSQTGSQDAPPTEIDPEPTDLDNVVIRIEFDGQAPTWILQEQPIRDIAQIREQLAAIGKVSTDVPVILWPEGTVPLQHVIAAFDAAKSTGYSKVSYAISNR